MTAQKRQHDFGSEEFDALVNAACNGALSQEDAARLEALLQGNADAQEQYLDQMCLDRWLRWEFARNVEAPSLEAESEKSWIAIPAPVFHAVGGAVSGTAHYFSSGWPLAYAITTAVFAIALLVGSITKVSTSTPAAQTASATKSNESRSPLDDQLPDSLAGDAKNGVSNNSSKKAPLFVGRITGECDCRWNVQSSGLAMASGGRQPPVYGIKSRPKAEQGANAPRSPSLVAFGDKLTVAAGLLEITFDTGAKVILEGPCRFNVEKNGGFLAVGRLTGRMEKRGEGRGARDEGRLAPASTPGEKVLSRQWSLASDTLVNSAKPQAASSKSLNLQIPKSPSLPTVHCPPSTAFVIATPTAIVTDLGTEFGVEVERDGRTTSHVFRGSVQVQVASAARNDVKAAEKKLLRANESVCIEIKRDARGNTTKPTLRAVEVNPRTFTRLLPDGVDHYVELVHSLKPVAYYRMERPSDPKDNRIVTDCVGGHHGVLHVGVKSRDPWQKGIIGGALYFDGKTYVDVPTLPGAVNGELSTAAWVFVGEHLDWANIASEQYASAWDGVTRRMQFSFGLFADGDLWAGVCTRDGHWPHVREGERSPLHVGYWTHVAFVADGRSLRLYRSGVEVASIPCDRVCRVPSIKHLMIGCKNWNASVDSPKVKPMQFWLGRMDELAIFNHALSANEVRRLCRCGLRELEIASVKKE